MMRTTILLTAILLSMLSASAVYAQRVEAVLVDGHPVINCDGMSSSVYTTTPKGNTEEVLKTPEANSTVYKRLAVSKSNNSTSSTWSPAFTVCSGISGGTWRLPTQRELMLMWVLKAELERAAGFAKFDATYYWSATAIYFISAWHLNFGNGLVATSDLGNNEIGFVRCVREL